MSPGSMMFLVSCGVIGPDAGEAVGLQLHAHLERVGLRLAHALARGLDLIGDAEQLLHVMADLMRDDIGLGHVARRVEAVLQLLVEVEVDIDLLVVRAVERAHLRQPSAAGRAHAAGEQHQLGIAIALAVARQDIPPDILGVAENDRRRSA